VAFEAGNRIEVGTDKDPFGGIVIEVVGGIAVIEWDGGGQTVLPAALLNLIARDHPG